MKSIRRLHELLRRALFLSSQSQQRLATFTTRKFVMESFQLTSTVHFGELHHETQLLHRADAPIGSPFPPLLLFCQVSPPLRTPHPRNLHFGISIPFYSGTHSYQFSFHHRQLTSCCYFKLFPGPELQPEMTFLLSSELLNF